MLQHYDLRTELSKRILVLDGAMGTMLQALGCHEGCNDMLALTRPEVVADVHRRYLQAGADIIETNTFNAQRISLADYALTDKVTDINLAAARLARRLADEQTLATPDKPRFVAGSVGPTNKALSMSPDINDPALRALTFEQLENAYMEQMQALLQGGVDALLIETIFDTLNAKAAAHAAQRAMQAVGREVPLMLSVTVSDKAGRTLSGQTLEAFIASMEHVAPLCVGLNCSFGAADMLVPLRHLAEHAPYYISVYPNAGLPNQLGQYDETPASMRRQMQAFIEQRLANIVGGCCGTTDEHIAQIAQLVSDAEPHTPAPQHSELWLSGLELLPLTPERGFINVGERCNVAGSRKFLRLVKEGQWSEALDIARKQVDDGALVLDINMDDALLDARSAMTHFLCLLAAEPEIARVPVMVDSSDWNVIRDALGCIQGKAIVNSISLKEGEEVFLSHARELRRMGAAVVVMAFDEEGQATTYERRIEVCSRAYRLLTEQVGMPARDIIFDPNVLTVATGMAEHDAYALDFIRATEWIRTYLPEAHVSGGISNLSFAFRGNNYVREAMHAVFLYHARRAGMDFAILNPATRVTYADIEPSLLEAIEDVILCRRPDATERLTQMVHEMSAEAEAAASAPQTDNVTQSAATDTPLSREALDHRLAEALRRGTTNGLQADLMRALELYGSPVAIIEGPLMQGMNRVGQLFGEGKMFLPQVVKTARTMKSAVEMLQPYMTDNSGSDAQPSQQRPRVLLATVRGDVHDIGKNIVAVVMACNGFDVTDLGVMVAPEDIVAAARELHPQAIGLSGLITPSLAEMQTTVRMLDEAGIRVPVMIGGATTSRLHTALRIATAYSGAVLHVADASQNVPMLAPFLDPATANDATAQLHQQQDALRQQHATPDTIVSLEEARAKKPKFF